MLMGLRHRPRPQRARDEPLNWVFGSARGGLQGLRLAEIIADACFTLKRLAAHDHPDCPIIEDFAKFELPKQ